MRMHVEYQGIVDQIVLKKFEMRNVLMMHKLCKCVFEGDERMYAQER